MRFTGTDVSRDHADITSEPRGYVLRDKGSRFGTFVNGQQVTEHVLKHRDVIRLGQSSECELAFIAAGFDSNTRPVPTSGDFRQIATLLEGLRALGSGRVLDDVLTMVIDSAIEVTGAERGFIMLAGADSTLDFKMGRGRGRVTLPGRTFETWRKIPDEVFATGEPRILDFADATLAQAHTATMMIGIRHVLCVPLVLVRYVEQAEADSGEKRIGVLYLDSREGGVLKSPATRGALEALAGEAAVAIENARLYREATEKARLEQELRIAAEIQQALMPPGEHEGVFFDVAGATVPCRAIGGDFFDYLELEGGSVGVALGDVSGKGAPAALLTAAVQGMFTVEADIAAGPAGTIAKINRGLKQRNIESKFVTMFFGVLSADGSLVYCNGGHNAPVLVQPSRRVPPRDGRHDPRHVRLRLLRPGDTDARARRHAGRLQRRHLGGAEPRRRGVRRRPADRLPGGQPRRRAGGHARSAAGLGEDLRGRGDAERRHDGAHRPLWPTLIRPRGRPWPGRRVRRAALLAWIACAVVIWNVVFDGIVVQAGREYLTLQALGRQGRGPR